MSRIAFCMLALCLLSACGQKGALFLSESGVVTPTAETASEAVPEATAIAEDAQAL